jgi:hypothetical protein
VSLRVHFSLRDLLHDSFNCAPRALPALQQREADSRLL